MTASLLTFCLGFKGKQGSKAIMHWADLFCVQYRSFLDCHDDQRKKEGQPDLHSFSEIITFIKKSTSSENSTSLPGPKHAEMPHESPKAPPEGPVSPNDKKSDFMESRARAFARLSSLSPELRSHTLVSRTPRTSNHLVKPEMPLLLLERLWNEKDPLFHYVYSLILF